MSDSRRSPPLEELPTVRPADIAWLQAASPLLSLPPAVGVLLPGPLPVSSLERWLAFFAAAEALEVEWGARRGAVRTATFPLDDSLSLCAIAAFGRLALVTFTPEKALGLRPIAMGVHAAASGGRAYGLAWSAAVYVQALEEGLW